jgi:hypothetical protein
LVHVFGVLRSVHVLLICRNSPEQVLPDAGDFLFIMIFLDRHSLWTQWKLHKAQARLEEDCRFYQDKIREAKEEAEDLKKQGNRQRLHETCSKDVFVIARLASKAIRKMSMLLRSVTYCLF